MHPGIHQRPEASGARPSRPNRTLPFTVDDEQFQLVAVPARRCTSSTSSALDPYWTPFITANTPTFSAAITPSSSSITDDDSLSTGIPTSASMSTSTSSSTSTSTISLTALPPLTTTTTTTPRATVSHANHPLLPASPSSPSLSATKDKVQAIVLGSLLGCVLGAVTGWEGDGEGSSGTSKGYAPLDDEEVDAFVGQFRPFDEQGGLFYSFIKSASSRQKRTIETPSLTDSSRGSILLIVEKSLFDLGLPSTVSQATLSLKWSGALRMEKQRVTSWFFKHKNARRREDKELF
ncbi:hypothetical protein BD410DRAFT_840795 [Rickenella mellea]|uniref:Uncharacterized protein n=1 Tax=Rickenella mellea TaxID=50990 RepID=A0A4Y7Q0Z8_9AGAM|nr:hypothetical protein BD410DRAFT_840795 [Rickenella mellea]